MARQAPFGQYGGEMKRCWQFAAVLACVLLHFPVAVAAEDPGNFFAGRQIRAIVTTQAVAERLATAAIIRFLGISRP